jgi:hypothetical protein
MNRKIAFLIFAAITTIGLSACRDKETDEVIPQNPKVNLYFSHKVGTDEIVQGQFYNRSQGESFSFDMLKYYLSKAALVNDAGDTLFFTGHNLMDAFNPNRKKASGSVKIDDAQLTSFNQLIFGIGVSPEFNTSGDQAGDLDPGFGMIWTWSTGYIFMKHEGQFIDSTGAIQPLLYHLGTTRAYQRYSVPINVQLKKDKTYNIHVDFDFAQVYNNPNLVTFTDNNIIQSSGSQDIPWITDVTQNMHQAFSVSSIQIK